MISIFGSLLRRSKVKLQKDFGKKIIKFILKNLVSLENL